MDVFDVRDRLIEDYREFTSSFVDPRDAHVRKHVETLHASGYQWPAPYLSLNPNFATGGTIDELIAEGLLHPDNARIFRIKKHQSDPGNQPLLLHQHQREAIVTAQGGHSFVLTTGTGSGKSLSYIVPIVDRVLRAKADGTYQPGVKAIIVYPMNALANSQLYELEKFVRWGFPDGAPPVSFDRYTGQENAEAKRRILNDPPDILLTNYVMLELVLTRHRERDRLIRAARGLWFLVLDELHTYRGRQGADVAFLVRRAKDACAAPDLQCIGTSATMTTEGDAAYQRAAVADVATRLFGQAVQPEHVIGESLRRATTGGGSDAGGLAARVRHWHRAGHQPDLDAFRRDPLAHWVESTFGVEPEEGTGRLVRKRVPRTVPDAADNLAQVTGEPIGGCQAAIQAILQAGAQLIDPETDRPVFAFRLHQFLSKGDNVYVTVESPARRHITSRYQTVSPDSGPTERKILVPLAFCRECGQEYLTVRRTVNGFEARQDADSSEDGGYLYLSDDQPWPESLEIAVQDGRLPYSWTVLADDGSTVPAEDKRKYLPEVVHIDAEGFEVDPGKGVIAAWVAAPFRFCLRCRVSYERQRGKDFAQLAKLSTEGRSSALSVIGASVVRALRAEPALGKAARKLLSFVDNRQDASLQAGHFNDFVQVVQLRGALYRAAEKEPEGLTHERVAQQVTEALGLQLAEFARRPEVRYGKEEIRRALRELVNYRLYLDLERGWRVTMPNLEQTGLLRIGYRYLDEVAADQEIWEGSHHLLRDDSPEHRYEIAATLLDEMRRNLAIDVRCLTEEGFDEIRRLSVQHLAEPWALGVRERSTVAAIAFPKPSGKGRPRSYLHLSGRGALGKYLKRQYERPGQSCGIADAQGMIRDLLAALTEAGLVIQAAPGEGEDLIGGYRLRSDALLWQAGDGKAGAEDRVRKQLSGEVGARVNTFFRDLYRDTSHLLTGLQAKEHTAQVTPDVRQEREREFREGDLPLLFCSPTMELGVDIKELNAVALRNVPPTPANYAQRAGRAGRSGQPALVVTYCSTGSAHDQYYFKRQTKMVGGAVQPPRLDLANEDLVRSHLQAIWLAETKEELPSSLAAVMETGGDNPALELLAKLKKSIDDPEARRRALARATDALASDLDGELPSAPWWRPTWVADVIERAPRSFEEALDRWRKLYRAAFKEYEVQGRRAVDTNVSHKAREEAHRRANDARVQLDLLRNEDSDEPQTDFYTYRYLASEGFLPGYSFPRLPLAAYIPGLNGQRQGDYIHRPRFIGISEFGPGALIYHEGARYMVRSVQLQQAAEPGKDNLLTTSARRCRACGHLHDDVPGIDVCESCGERLGVTDENLLRPYTVRTQRRERISSDEEERRRSGFQIETSYRFHQHGGRPGKLTAMVAPEDGSAVATLVYGDAATVRRANLGLTRRKDQKIRGFWLDTTNGEWLSESKAAERTTDEEDLGSVDEIKRKQRVIPYVEDRRNILVLRLARKARHEEAMSLLYALERGIEATFQLEDSELTGELLPDLDEQGRMLFIESAEGGAGVLRRLVEEPAAISQVAAEALRIAHFDPVSGEEAEQGVFDGDDRCVQGCYDCLLSYSNQPYHRLIDRHLITDLLLDLAGSRTTRNGTAAAAAERLDTSARAAEFVAWLTQAGYRTPDGGRERMAEALVDLVYRDHRAAVFVDAADEPFGAERDLDAEESLIDAGWTPIRAAVGEWQQAVDRYPSVFGQHQAGAR
ncbi:DEAD/DEAH box helicase [Micromonospora craterilacus]|uniref:DEAD/DEAH box helicase n=1 Tax=Micromonospora craterilacus TaxID=1655439 RepID=A0A2W2DYA5_9ACTN|nr:DEAD/DEAH box helicase [Micromonospora craterilacus]PZG15423.1 DEAD/DEAH box helicase [Micromonospora craterilacus]